MTKEHAELERKLRDHLNSKENLTADEMALKDRLNGRLPTLDIAGQIFDVDFHMETLRPQNDFSSQGISFYDLQSPSYEDSTKCGILYDPTTRKMVGPQAWFDITEMPENIVEVSFPRPKEMDRVGYARTGKQPLEDLLKEKPQKAHFEAKILSNEKLKQKIDAGLTGLGLQPLKVKRKTSKVKR